MSYKISAVDEVGQSGPEPFVVMTAFGTTDVASLVSLLNFGSPDHVALGAELYRLLRQTPGGKAATLLLGPFQDPDE